MITFKDFDTKEELEKFQNENNIKAINAETIQKEKWISEWFIPGLKYSEGWRKYNSVRLFYVAESLNN